MPYKDKEKQLEHTRKWWKEHPIEYEQHKFNCVNNRRIAQLKKDVGKLKKDFDLPCIVGVLEHTELINSKDILKVIENAKISHTPLFIGYKGKELIIVKRDDYINEG